MKKKYLVLVATVVILSACCMMDEKTGFGYSSDSVSSENSLASLDPTKLGPGGMDPSSLLSKRTIYFVYDSSQVQQNFIPMVAAHAQYLMDHPEKRIVLEGYADERGSREYNIALGEQRAKSVYEMMTRQGVPKQMEVVSYGEENPASNGMNEEAWQLNRRVEIVY